MLEFEHDGRTYRFRAISANKRKIKRKHFRIQQRVRGAYGRLHWCCVYRYANCSLERWNALQQIARNISMKKFRKKP